MADQSIIDALFGGPSWLERANQERLKAQAAYLQGGPAAMMQDTSGIQGLAGGFGGTIKPVNPINDFMNYWTNRGIRNFVADRPTRNEIQLSDLVVPEEMRGQGIGTEFMKALTGLADQQGKTLTLTAAKDYGTTSLQRLKDFYKQHGFVENKGRNKDFAISDSMYRKPITNGE